MSIVSYAIVFAIIGIALHIVDIVVGKDWYRSLWDSSHKLPLPVEVTRGFITGRSTKERLLTSLIITVIFAVLIYKLGDQKFLGLLGDCLGMFVGLLVGFALGGFFKRRTNIEAATNKVLASLDSVDHGDLPDVREIASSVAAGAEKLRRQAGSAGERLVGAVTGERGSGSAVDNYSDERSVTPASEPEPAAKRTSVANAARQFSKRG